MGSSALHTPCYLVEWYGADLIEDRFCMALANLSECVTATNPEGAAVRIVHTLTVPSDQVVFGVIAASSEEVVADLCRRAGVPAGRVTPAISTRLSPCDI
jgi:hypothetical protein